MDKEELMDFWKSYGPRVRIGTKLTLAEVYTVRVLSLLLYQRAGSIADHNYISCIAPL